jgi:hypothetical protein
VQEPKRRAEAGYSTVVFRDGPTRASLAFRHDPTPREGREGVTEPIAMITGASEGIGRALALRLAAEGFRVVAVARNEERLRSLMAELRGPVHEYLVADLATRDGVAACVARLGAGHCRVLVNCAGAGLRGDFVEISVERHRELIALDVEAVVALSHAFLVQAGTGDVLVNVSSVLAVAPNPLQPTYAAAKAFVSSFTQSLWHQQRARGVRVLELRPGSTASRFRERSGGQPRVRASRGVATADQVAALAQAAIRRAPGPVVTPGLHNRLLGIVAGLLPRSLWLRVVARALVPSARAGPTRGLARGDGGSYLRTR